MGCIYCATNIIDGKKYIGKTIYDLEYRKRGHKKESEGKCRFVFHRALRKHGFDNFVWTILFKHNDNKILNFIEIDQIRELNTKTPNGYNMTDGGDGGDLSSGRKRSEETKRKMSNARKGIPLSEKHKAKLSISHKGQVSNMKGKKHSDKTKKKISKYLTGKKHSSKTIEKRRISNLGKKRSKEFRELMSKLHKGRKHTDEAKKKMSIANMGNIYASGKRSEEAKKRMSESHKGKPWSEARRKVYEEKMKPKQE